jgi:hypothetical protein
MLASVFSQTTSRSSSSAKLTSDLPHKKAQARLNQLRRAHKILHFAKVVATEQKVWLVTSYVSVQV